ncbi:MAG: ABC transporter substrate-binding protein [Acidimicrobiia bacterium]|nr:ABC transporter substrate-binding protein [Acidimicrobiia bacterium]
MLAGSLSLALVAAACGSDDGDSAGGTTTAAGASTTASSSTTAGGTPTTAGAQPTSIEDWEALWAQEREAIITRIKDNGWGKSADGTTLTGPGGWTVDLSACPAGWSDTEGVTDTTIKIGASISLSGTYADYGNYGVGIKYLFDYYNEEGFFEDASGKVRQVDYITKDDAYDTARAIPNVDELLDSDKAFAVWTLGTPSTLRTYDKINERCVPHPLAITFHSAWGDPVNHPWTTGAPNPTYSTEAILWGSFIEQRLDEFPADQKVKVASLVQNNDFGKLYDVTFRAYLEQSDLLRDRVDYVSETVEATAPTVTDPMTSLAAENPDVYISMLGGAHCTQTVLEAAQNGMKDTTEYLFLGQGCTGASWIGKDKLGGDGSAGDGWWVISNGVKDMRDPAFAEDPYVQWLREGMEAKGIDPDASVNIGGGINFAFPVAQALVITGQLEGGVTRTNFQLAMRAMDMTSPMLLEGIRLHMDGLDDPYIVEAGLFQTWDAANQTYIRQGDIIDLEGRAEPCAWDQTVGACA